MAIEKQVAVVMGGGGAIGRSICFALAERGIQVVVGDISADHLKACTDELNRIGSTPYVIVGDLSNKADVARMQQDVAGKFGRADILINAHGDNKNELLFKLTEDNWKKTIAVHLEGTLNAMLAFGAMMKERNYGRIVNMSSIAARGSIAGAAYGAAKTGIEGLSRVAALEWARYNITVNCLAPGLIGGQSMFMRTTPKEYQAVGIDKTPMKRAGKPEEVAACARFLASEEAGFITGQIIAVDGGLSIGF
jgi:3-oxoacyl-[acyl-carrier protein] reductase